MTNWTGATSVRSREPNANGISEGKRLSWFNPSWRAPLIALFLSGRLSIGILCFALAIILAMWTAMDVQISQERFTKINEVMRENANLARAFDEHTIRTLAHIDEIVNLMKKRYEVEGAKFDLQKFYREAQPNPAVVHNAVITDASGQIILSSGETTHISLADREHIKIHFAGDTRQLFVSKPVLARVNKQWSIIVTRRANSKDGTLAGVVAVAIDPNYFSNFYRDVDLGRDGVVTLIGLDGVVRARLDQTRDAIGKQILHVDTFLKFAATKSTSLVATSEIDKIERIYASRRVEGYPLLVVVGTSLDDALARVIQRSHTYRHMFWAASGLIGAFAFLLVWFDLRRTHAQHLLRISEQQSRRLASIVENSNDAIFSRALDGTVLTWNAGAEKMLGYTAAEIIGNPVSITLTANCRSYLEKNNEALLHGEVIQRESNRMTKEGRVIDVRTSHSPIRNTNGSIVGASVIMQDITALKQAQIMQRESDQRMRLATEATGVGIWEWNVINNQVRWDAQMFRIYGVPPTDDGHVEYSTWSVCVLPEDLQEQESILQDIIRRRIRSSREFRIGRGNDKECRYIQAVETVRTNEQGQVEWVVGTNLDITERKQSETARASLEAQLRESQKMQAIGTLAGGIAHDFNNMVAAILGNAELAMDDVRVDPQAALESIEEIRKAAQRARDLVHQILSFSRRQPTVRRAIALAPVIDESVHMLRAMIPPRLSITGHCALDVPAVLADPTQIQQILVNLATNAMHAMKGNGRIEIRAEAVMLDSVLANTQPLLHALYLRHPGRAVRIAVSDTGSGMDAAMLERIFEPFFTTKPVGEGTGLGLSVVYGIVQTHEGAIMVDSTPGKGTTFTIYLPIAEGVSAAPVVQASVATTTSSQNTHVLYLDDDKSLVFLVKRLLERRGYRVSGFTDQKVALATIRADPAAFDLVLTDYNMPGMSGLDVARETRLIRADLPVAVTSGFIDEQLQAKAAEAGVQQLIFKADAIDVLCDAVQSVVQSMQGKQKPA